MNTLLNAVSTVTETKNMIANGAFIAVVTFIAVTLIAVAVKIATNPEAIVIGNF